MRYFKCFFTTLFFIAGLTQSVFAQIPTDSLKLHLKADIGITSSGDSVNVWADQSGNGNDGVQANLVRRPVFVSNSLNGKPVIQFNGVNSFLTLPTASQLGIRNNDYEIFIVSRSASVNTDIAFLLAGNTEQYELHLNGSAGARFIPKSSTYIDEGSIGDYSDANAHIYNVRATDTYGNVTVDAVDSTNSAVNARSSDSGNLYLGVRFDNSYTLNGDIAEVIIYNTVLSATQRGLVENYLGAKYGIEVPSVTPSVQASNITISGESDHSMTINLTKGNGAKRLIVAKKGSPVDFTPVDGTTYNANSSFESGAELGNGNYIIYNDSGDEVTLSNLQKNHHYYFAAYEYFGSEGSEKYLSVSPGTGDGFTTGYAFEEISSLAMWLRADAGIADPSNGALVSIWADTSGSDADAVQGSSTLQPAVTANSLNGMPGVSFDGIDNYFTLPTSSELGIQNSDYELFIVAKPASSSNVEFLFSGSAIPNYEVHINGGQGVRYIPGGSTYLDAGTTGEYSDGGGHIYHINATSTGGFVQVDGGVEASSSSNLQNATNTVLELARRGNNSLFYTGDIHEVLLFNASLSSENRDSITTYLSDKYGISYIEQSAPELQASNPVFSNITNDQLTLSVTKGGGLRRIILAKEGSSVDGTPTNSTVYSSSSVFGSGDEIGTGNYVVYTGTDSVITVTGLTSDTEYHFAVFEYNGRVNEEQYLTTNPATANATTSFSPISIQSQTLTETTASSATFTAVVNRSVSLSTSYRILWGTDSSSLTDSSTTIVRAAGASTDTVSYEITGLSDNTIYYVKLRAITSQENILSDAVSMFFNNTIIPSDSLTLWLNADMSLSGVGDGESISVWYDLSGKENNGTQDNSSYKPVMATNQINGLPAVSFNGNSYFSLPSAQELEVVNKDYEIIIVASTASSQRTLLFGNSYTSGYAPNIWLNYDQGFLFNGNSYNGNDFTVGESGEYSNDEYHVFNVIGTDTEGSIRIDNVPKRLDESESYRNSVNGDWIVGASVRSDGYISDYFNGQVAEIIVYNKKLSSLERFEINEYLSDKYDLGLPLGSPDQQTTGLEFETSGATSATLNYTIGNGAYNLVVVKAESPVDALPIDSTTYTASSVFGSGAEIGSENFVVYAGLDSSITITGLTQGITYHATVYSFNGDPGLEKYLTINTDTVSLSIPITLNISQLSPTPFSLNNAKDSEIEVTFDKTVNPSSFVADSSFFVTGSEGGVYTGTIHFSVGNTVATFTPDSIFKAGETITVNITNKLEGVSHPFKDPKTFSFHIETAFSSATFERNKALGQGTGALLTEISDLNGDKKGDIYMVDSGGSVHVRLNNGNGNYGSKTDYYTGVEDPGSVAADIDGDGDLDIILSNDDNYDISILKNNGNGTFASSIDVDLGSYSYSIEAADLDHDGNIDLIVGTDSVLVSLNTDGTGSFSSHSSYLPGSSSYNIIDLAASDMDADGDVDIIVLNDYDGFYLLKNNGDGTFQESILLDRIDSPSSVSVGDLDGDGDGDFVISTLDDYRIYVYKNNGDATFAARVQYQTGDVIERLTLSDIDGDGDLDIIGKEESDTNIHLFLNSGDGTYPSYSIIDINYNVRSFSVSDFDNDNDVDLFVATYDSLYIYENIDFDPLTFTGTAGWRFMASPVGNVEYSGLLENLWTQGASNADTESGVPNVYVWPSTATTVSDTNWTAITNLADSLQSGSGMLMYVFSDDNGPEAGDAGFPKEVNFPGTEPTNTKILTSLLNTNEDGWTLLGNPFYSQIDWDDFSRDGLSSSVYVYDVNASGWKSWNGTLGSLTDGIIDTYKAFFVQSIDVGDLYLQINYPNDGGEGEGGGLVDKAVSTKNPQYFSIELSDTSGLKNKAWFQFSEDGEFGLDASDAHQLNPLSSNYVTLASILNDTTHLDINSLPLITEPFEISLALQTSASGTKHQISKGDLNIPEGWEITLYDSELDVTTDLDEEYVFTLNTAKVKTQNLASPQNKVSPPNLESIFKQAREKKTGPRFTITVSPSQAVNNEPVIDLPTEVELGQNYPNPFNPSTTISYGVPNTGKVTLEVFDILGRKVATLLNGENKTAGRYTLNFNASNLASGMYIYRLRAGNVVMIKKLTLIK